ncbi:MAG: S41 family peptidase [Lachnospiraceae bacterium]|nr:S41 family peptidase [Lachnospiraceae bacterium]MEE3460312.1 S41 family peptidase [Lachnospiraceae bacterium]
MEIDNENKAEDELNVASDEEKKSAEADNTAESPEADNTAESPEADNTAEGPEAHNIEEDPADNEVKDPENEDDRKSSREKNLIYLEGIISGFMIVVIVASVLTMTGLMDPGFLFTKSASKSAFTNEDASKLKTLTRYIDRFYDGDVDQDQMADGVFKGLVAGLNDPYAAYFNKDELKSMQETTNGSYKGIGAVMTQDATTGAIIVVEVVKDSPADKAGIGSGDVFLKADGKDLEGMTLDQAVELVRGKEGTKVSITIRKPSGEEKTVECSREEIKSETVGSASLDDGLFYIRVTAFDEVTKDQFKKALETAEKEKAKGLIIDLRDNGGGLLSTAQDMLDRFLPEGKLLVYTKDKNGKKEELMAEDKDQCDIPAAILVNKNTASASEVFSGCLLDYKKAVLVGAKTFGKGIVQTSYAFDDGTAIKFTTAKYYTPKGKNIHGTGFTPEIKVPSADTADMSALGLDEADLEADECVAAAIDYLKKE